MAGAPDRAANGGITIPEEGFGLVFMGGGAKGAYQLGVWQALRELEIPIRAVTGASIGSINGALLAQNNFEKALEAWHSVKVSQIVKLEGLSEASDNLLDPRNLAAVAREFIQSRGLDNGPLRETLASLVDEDMIRASSIAYGMTTFSKTDLSTTEIFVEDIPRGQLLDYIMASSCFPIFKPVHIGETDFIDGGIGDNMPVRMLLRRGVKHIITVDIGGVGVVHPVWPGQAQIIPIRHSLPLGGLFDLSPDTLNFNQELGRLDTLKVFGRLKGKSYFFSPEEYDKMTGHFSRHTCQGLEEAALLYELPQAKLYTAQAFFSALLNAFETHQPRFEEALKRPAIMQAILDVKETGNPAASLDGPMRLHRAMEALSATRRTVRLPFNDREYRAAAALLTLLRLGPPDEKAGES
jgi:NTE family protein